MKIAIVAPSFNEKNKIGVFLEDIKNIKMPIIIIDDGSTDETAKIISEFRKNPNIILIKHKINLGKGAALKTGCSLAFNMGMDAVVIMDSDGQHLISDLPKFIKALNSKKYDLIFGSRSLNFGIPLVRFVGNKFASALVSLLFGIYISDLICGYRAFTKKAFEKIDWQSSGYGVETEMVIKTGLYKLKSCEVPVQTVYYDKFKGVTIIDALGILVNVLKWRISI